MLESDKQFEQLKSHLQEKSDVIDALQQEKESLMHEVGRTALKRSNIMAILKTNFGTLVWFFKNICSCPFLLNKFDLIPFF